jgi:hypothetical protein
VGGTDDNMLWKELTKLHGAVLPEKLTGPQLVKKFLTICGTQRLIAAFTRAYHLSLS